MPSSPKDVLRAVVEAAAAAAAGIGRSIEDLRGIAFHDTRKDEVFTALGAFGPAVAAVTALPLVKERFGGDEAPRLVLQFLFEYFDRVDRPAFVADAFDAVWNAFDRELAVVMLHTPDLWKKAQRVIGALRLVAPGDVGIGPMWVVRPSHFRVGGLTTQVGFPIPSMGPKSEYKWTTDLAAAVRHVYTELEQLEVNGYGKAPGNLDPALRSFMATYDRWPPGPDSRLLDSITALEATLGFGGKTEITFKLAFRLAALLAADDAARGAMLEETRTLYDTRSTLVHGDRLWEKHLACLNNVDELRSRVRRLLRSFVHLAVIGSTTYTKQFWEKHLDATLLDAPKREALRLALDLA